MKITNEEMDVINDVIGNLAKDFTFDIYDADDIEQEVFIICIDLLEKYDSSKGELFPYLLGAARNRLISFKREKYYNSNTKTGYKKLALLETKNIIDKDLYYLEEVNDVAIYDDYISKNIPAGLKEDYLRMKEGISVNPKTKYKILEYVNTVIENQKVD